MKRTTFWLMGLSLFSAAALAQNNPNSVGCVGSPSSDCLRPGELPIIAANTAPGKFAARMILLADQLERNVDLKLANASYMIGSFLDLNNLNSTSPMGRLIAENLMHELQVRNWRIFEPRLMKNFLINEGGEFVLSRDVKQLRDRYSITGVVAGTYSVSNDYTVINARVVNIDTGLVVSSGQIQIPSSWYANGLMAESTNRPMKLIGAAQ
ncbi:MAG: hypothetical protein OHK0048_22980 [Rhodoferax sp.]